MPVAATGVEVSRDGQYIFGSGIYKPRVRCYDVTQFSMKFERCVDAEVTDMLLLSEDYTKVTNSGYGEPSHPLLSLLLLLPSPFPSLQFVLLLANRQLEFHSQVHRSK